MNVKDGNFDKDYAAMGAISDSVTNGQLKQAGRMIEKYGIKKFIIDYEPYSKKITVGIDGAYRRYKAALRCWANYNKEADDEE